MAVRHGVEVWKTIFHDNVFLLPHPERQALLHENSSPFLLNLKGVENVIEKSENSEYEIRVSLYDSTFKQFVGRTWCGPWSKVVRGGKVPQLKYNQIVVFHTAIMDKGLLVVMELVCHEGPESTPPKSCGWTFFSLLHMEENKDMPDCIHGIDALLRLPLYHGSPRALLYMNSPSPDDTNLTKISQCELSYGIFTHRALQRVQHLLPENILIGSHEHVPGMGTPVLFGKPKPKPAHPCYLDKVRVMLPSSVEAFEEVLCRIINTDRMKREALGAPDGRAIQINKRLLQVGIHNGWTYIDEPVTIQLTEDTGSNTAPLVRKASMRSNRNNSSTQAQSRGGMALVHRHRVQLEGLLADPELVVVFLLIYECSLPQKTAVEKTSLTTASFNIGVRYAALAPLAFAHSNQPVSLELIGGPELCPDSLLLFRGPSADRIGNLEINEELRKLGAGEISFRVHHEPLPGAPPAPVMAQQAVQAFSSKPAPYMSSGQARHHQQHDHKPKHEHYSHYSPPPSPPSPASSTGMGLGLEDLQTHSHRSSSRRSHKKRDDRTSGRLDYGSHPYPGTYQEAYPPLYMQKQQAIVAAPPHMPHGYMPIEIQHITNEGILEQESRLGTAVDLKELPFTPVHAPIMPVVPGMHAGQKLPRAVYAQLYSAGFPPILDRRGDAADVVDPQDVVQFFPAKEENDRLSANEIYFQFLAFARSPDVQQQQPSTVFFTFQFYRFPQVTTQRLLLGAPKTELAIDTRSMPCLLYQLEKDGSVRRGPPGYQIKYDVDPSFLKPGETQMFLNHLANQTLHIDVWDGDSLHLLGSCAVELIHLCRQGREGVQVTYELDVVQNEYLEREGVGVQAGDMTKEGTVHPVEVRTIPRGKLHLRLANVGHQPEGKVSRQEMLFSKSKRLVSSEAGLGSFLGGSLNSMGATTKPVLGSKVCKAQPLIESNRELASALFTKKEKLSESTQVDPEKKRKLMRMQAIRTQTKEPESDSKIVPSFRLNQETRLRDLKTIEFYRMQDKKEGILHMLSRALTTEHVVHPTMGGVEFFEFAFRNPTNQEQTLVVTSDDPDLSVVTDAREWRHFKVVNEVMTPLEQGLFNLEGKSGKPEIFVRPKEKVLLPVKYLSVKADHSVKPVIPLDPSRNAQEKNLETFKQSDALQPRTAHLTLSSPDGKAVAILAVKVEPQPHVVDQTFRFYQPEHSFFKKNIRLPPIHTVAGLPVGDAGYSQLYVRCSDPNVICDSRKVQQGEPHDIFVKAAVSASPQVKKFFIAIYTDPYLSRPLQTWQFLIHAMQRVDVACIEGQTSRFTLVLRGVQASRLVQVFSSHPQEMTVEPANPFMLPANTIQELCVGVRPQQAGGKFLQLNVVDVDTHQLVRNWLVCLSARSPVISKVFELMLPLGGGKGSNKRISYKNPYSRPKLFHLLTNREDLLQFREPDLEVGPGESAAIGLKFSPYMYPTTVEVLVFLNDEDDKTEEAFCIKASYQ